MRSPNAAALTELGIKLGTEPVFIIHIDWSDSITLKYADKDIFDVPGRIIAVSSLDAVIKIGSGGTSQSLDVTLDDSDESIKAIIDANDPHKRPARVFQAFEGLLETDKFLLFSGTIVTPIRWNERDRQLSFSIESNIEDQEVGFSPEQGEFEFISDKAVGKAWPLCFGSPLRVPAVKLTERVRGTSLTRYGLLTQNDLDTLCNRAETLASQEVIKTGQDGNAGVTQANYNITLGNIASAQASLNVFLEGLIVDSPTQEDDLRTFVETCKEIQIKTEERTAAAGSVITIDESLDTLNVSLATKQIQLINANKTYETTPNPTNLQTIVDLQREINRLLNGVPDPIQQSVQRILDYEALIIAENAKVGDNNPFTIKDQTAINNWDNLIIVEKGFLESQSDFDDIVIGPPYNPDPPGTAIRTALLLTLNADDLSGIVFLEASRINFLNVIAQRTAQLLVLETTKTTLIDSLNKIILSELIVKDGEQFPQGSTINIIVNGAKFSGSFAGEIFTITNPEIPLFTNVALAERQNTNANEFWIQDASISLKGQYVWFGNGLVHVSDQDGTRCFINPIIFKGGVDVIFGILTRQNFDFRLIDGAALSADVILETSSIILPKWLNFINALNLPTAVTGLANITNQDYRIEIGDEVFIEGNYEDVYIANLIPSTSVSEVMAFRTVDGNRQLFAIPQRLYTIDLSESIAEQNATTIRFPRPLTEFVGENWEEQIYVSLTSSEGPNTADTIEYIVDTYLDLTIDAASFASVATSLTVYPNHFALLDLKQGLQLIEDIAFQARCAVFVKNNIVFIKYLSVDETSVVTLNTGNTNFGEFKVETTETEELVTKFVAIWQTDYVQIDEDEEPNKLILRNNIPKYGLLEKEFDFFIYNTKSLVQKSATFWIIRLSNTWKMLDCQIFLDSLEVEALDVVSLDFPNNLIASGSVKGVVLSADYDSNSHRIDLRVQSSVQAGELVSHPLFFSGSADPSITYPTAFDPFTGGAA